MSIELDKLERLERLHAAGGLTDAEFATEKQRLLNPGHIDPKLWSGPSWRGVGIFIAAIFVIGTIAITVLLLMPAPAREVDQQSPTADTPSLNEVQPLAAPAAVGEAAPAPAAAPRTDTMQMTCGMDECVWLALEKLTQTDVPGGARYMKIEYRAGTSTHPPRDDGTPQYPATYDATIPVEWEKGTGAVLCSTQNPTVVEPDEAGGFYATRLNLLNVIGAEEYSANLYMLVCHGSAPSQWGVETARGFGYTDRQSSQFKVAKPEAALMSAQ